MEHKKTIFDAFKRGEEQIEKTGGYPATWFQYYGLPRDPFKIRPLDPLQDERDEPLLVNRVEETQEIAEYIGMAGKAGYSFNLAIVGVEGVGKKTIVRTVNAYAQEKEYKGLVYDVKGEETIYPKNYEKAPEMGPPMANWRYVVLESPASFERTKLYIKKFVGKENLIISFWRPDQLPEDIDFDRDLYITPLRDEEIREMVFLRIKEAQGGTDLLSESALKLIEENSMGVPQLALELACHSFKRAYQKRKSVVQKEDVKEAASIFGYDVKKNVKLTTKEENIVKFLLKKETISPPELSSEKSISRVVAWKYLNRLHEKGLLKKSYQGRTSYFTLRTPQAIKLQLMLYSRRR